MPQKDNMKTCKRCNETKEISDFPKRKNSIHSECKECATKRTKEWVEKNREKVNKYQREYYIKNNVKEQRRIAYHKKKSNV